MRKQRYKTLRGPRNINYNVKEKETRGIYIQENKTLTAFWVKYSMDEAITWTPEEMEIKVEDFIKELAERSIARDPTWWYPAWKTIDRRHYK